VIFEAWSDEPWALDGAAVRVSLICFCDAENPAARDIALDGRITPRVHPNLTSGSSDLTEARRLDQNEGASFMATTKGGAFDIDSALARKLLMAPLNPNGRPNSDVVRPWWNGLDVTRRPRDMWIVDFGTELTERQAALYELPFQHALAVVKPDREKNRREAYAKLWWRFVEPRPKMRQALSGRLRVIATPTISKHRLFVWVPHQVCPDHQLIVVARDDDACFGVLHSRLHELWTL
jgi:hypothetical protein